MSERFWLTGTTTPFTPATVKGSWAVSVGADIQYLGRKPSGSTGTSTINVGATTANRDVMLNRFISDGALNAKTLSGTVRWMIGYKESASGLNGFSHIHIWVTQGNTDTVRGTLLTDSIGTTALPLVATGLTEGSKTVSSVAVQAGDRLVVEVGYRASASSTTQNATINYGGTGTTDLSSGDVTPNLDPGWIEFSGADGIWSNPIGNLVDTFSSGTVPDSTKWTSSAGVSVTGGRARISTTTATPNFFSTGTAFEIQSSMAAAQVPTLPVAGGGSTVTFSMYLMAGPSVNTTNLEIMYSPVTGNLQFRNNVGSNDASPTNVTYSSSSHQWWRFRESGGSIFMETSPDGLTWTAQRTISTMSQWMLTGNHMLYFESSRSGGTADFGEVDNVNSLPTGGTYRTVNVWNGSAWVAKPLKVWNGTAWVQKPVKQWNGSTWR